MQTYFFWVWAGRMLNQPDAKRSSVIEENVLLMELFFILDRQMARSFFEPKTVVPGWRG
jgi:hypothetical protein